MLRREATRNLHFDLSTCQSAQRFLAFARNDTEVLIIATGVVEPHQYAGYSGGGKNGRDRLRRRSDDQPDTWPQYLDHPGVRLGKVDGNPFQQFVRRSGAADRTEVVVNSCWMAMGKQSRCGAGDPMRCMMN